jgi:hypothetical protein
MVPDFVYKFQMIWLWGTEVIEQKQNARRTYRPGLNSMPRTGRLATGA